MKRWIGRSIVVIGLLHVAFGLVVFRSTLALLLREGVVNTVNGQPDREMAFWFLFFGFLVVTTGALIDWCEAKRMTLPRFLGWSLLAIALAGVLLMPASGFWVVTIPAVGAIRQAARSYARPPA